MFFLGTLRNWWINRSRMILHYWDGTRNRRIDPIVVGTRLEEKCPDYMKLLDTVYKDPASVMPGPLQQELVASQKAARDKLCEAARAVFDVKPLTEDGGLTDGETMRLLLQYFLYMEELASRATIFPTWQGVG